MAQRLCKRVRLARENFQQSVIEYLVSKGATHDSFYRFQIETKAGRLYITPYENWIAACFADVERAKQLLGSSLHGRLNPSTGKWNFHFADEALEGNVALDCFTSHVERLLLDMPHAPSPSPTPHAYSNSAARRRSAIAPR